MRWWLACALCLVACGTRSALDPGHVEAPPAAPPSPVLPPPPPPDAGTDAGPPDAGGPLDGGPPCLPDRAVLLASHVDVVFLIDRSSSMGWTIGTSTEVRWEILQTAMRDVLGDLDPRVSAGASFFPSGPRCALNDELDVPIAPNNVEEVLAAFDRGVIDSRSPIGHAYSAAARALIRARPEGRNRFIIALTDGEVSGCPPRIEPVPNVTTAREWYGIDTFAVGVAASGAWLINTAREGGRRRPDTGSYYAATDLDSLRQMLQEIEDSLTSCVFDVPLVTTSEARVTVLVGGVEVPYDARRLDGWAWSGIERGSISLFGPACARRREGGATLEAIVSCDDG